MSTASERKLRIGVAGLGRAFAVMLPTFKADPRVSLVAAADTRAEARQRFAEEFSANAYTTVEELCADPAVEVIYVATPHQWHARHAALAAQHRKHLLIEKPMALTLQECAAIIDAARGGGVHLVVGHSHSFDAPVRHLRGLIDSGRYGNARMINAINYTDYLYRPRRPEELDTALGGGAIFNQAAHQIDIVRLLGGGRVASVRAATGAWDRTRPTEGAYAALLTFENGVFASLTYSGYGNFDSDEFQGWIGEMGQKKDPRAHGLARKTLAGGKNELLIKKSRNYGGKDFKPTKASAYQHFGVFVVSCEQADLRPLPHGVMIYGDREKRLERLPKPRVPRAEVIDELYGAVVEGRAPLHSGESAMATLQVCLAMLESARLQKEIVL